MASIRMLKKLNEEKNARDYVEYGIVNIEEVTLPLDKEEKVQSIHRDNLGRYLILSNQGNEQNLITWNSKTNTITSRIKTPLIPHWITKARLLPMDGMLFCDTFGGISPHPIVFQTDPFQPVPLNGTLEGISRYAIVISANKTKLIAYNDDDKTIEFISIELNAVYINHIYPLSSFFPNDDRSEKIHCVGVCNLPGKFPRVAICIQDLNNKKEFIRIANLNLFTNALEPQECINIPDITTKRDRCGHDKGIFCLPDGRLVYAANHCMEPDVKKGVVQFDNFNRIILFSDPEWKITYSNVSASKESVSINRDHFNIFPYTQKLKFSGEFKSCMPQLGREITLPTDWEILSSLCQHTFFRHIPDSINPHRYAYYEVSEINFQFLERILGEKIASSISMPMVLCMLTASYAVDLSMFSPDTIKNAATLRATVEEHEAKYDTGELDVALRNHF